MKQRLIFFILVVFAVQLNAQEYTTISGYLEQNFTNNLKNTDTLQLPFFSDFSEANPYKFYTDNNTSIATYQEILPPSINAAMFDALDESGNYYATAYNQKTRADFLTSKPFYLDYSGDTTIYFSFFYEPKGLLDAPEQNDSLVLQFYAPNSQKWQTVWTATNFSDVEFKQVKIHITDTAFLQKGFKFRFYNVISMSPNTHPSFVSNCDFWFVDYIYLNVNRSYTDNYKRDVTFQYPTVLKIDDYVNVPYNHYKDVSTSVNLNIKINFRNNDDAIREIDSMYIVFEDKNAKLQNDTLYIGSYALVGNNNSNIKKNNISFSFPNNVSADYLSYNMKTVLITDTYDSTSNNIVNQTKKLGTTYAYDDGTSENGYGLFGDGTQFAYVAQQFTSYKTDNITGMRVFFNKTFNNEQPYYFYAVVWENDPTTGKPGNIVYEQEGFEIDHNNLNNFQNFKFNSSVSVSDTFYIGWMKVAPELMNVGLDLNFSGDNRKYYSIYNGEWNASSVSGAIMMQPIFGDINLASTDDLQNSSSELSVFPNPVSDIVNIQVKDSQNNSILYIYDISGKIILSKYFTEKTQVDLSVQNAGIYVLKVISDGQVSTQKIIKK